MAKDNLKINLSKSKIFTMISYTIGAIFFFISYSMSGNTWFLILAIVLIISVVVFLFVFNWLEKKFQSSVKKGND